MSSRIAIATEVLKIGSSIVWERISGMRPRAVPSIPPSFDRITREWLTSALCRDHPGAEVVEFDLKGGSSGSTVRELIHIRYNQAGELAGLPEWVFCKAAASFKTRMLAGLAKATHKEVYFFNSLRNELPIEAPIAYFGGVEVPSQRSILLLKAMSDCTFTNPTHYINRKESEDMVGILATLHGTFWNSPRLATMPWLDSSLEYLQLCDDLLSFLDRCAVGMERARAAIPAQLWARRNQVNAATRRAAELNQEGAITFLHHDVHIGNWYKTPAGRMGLGDWQCLAKGNWASDFSYAITSALTIEDRRAWEKELLELYLEELRRHSVQDVPDFDTAWKLYRQQIFHALSFWTFTIGFGALQPQMQPDQFSMINIERFANAAVDLDSLDSLGM